VCRERPLDPEAAEHESLNFIFLFHSTSVESKQYAAKRGLKSEVPPGARC
jgi:hypothetical protein